MRFALDNRARPIYWLRIFALFGWVLIIPPITPASEGLYVGSDSRPAEVGITVPVFQWTVYGRYQAAAECERTQSQLQMRSLQMNPENATAVAYSFAKCLEDNDQRLHPDNGSATWEPSPRCRWVGQINGLNTQYMSSHKARKETTDVEPRYRRFRACDSAR